MKKNILSAIIVALAFLPAQLSAQQSRTQKIINAALKGWNIELRAGYNLGGTSPIPLPVEIREIKSYKPSMGFSVESDFTKFFDEKWGLLVGVKLENKNMETDARVKNYGMEILSEGAIASGRWTGGVKTSVRNAFLTFPVQAAYKCIRAQTRNSECSCHTLSRASLTEWSTTDICATAIRRVKRQCLQAMPRQLTTSPTSCANFSGDFKPESTGKRSSI